MANNLKYVKVANTVHTYQLNDEPELIHVIKTGFDDLYIVVYEDAYMNRTGITQTCTAKELETKFGIDINKSLVWNI